MGKKILFILFISSIIVSLDVKAQVELYPLSQYSVGQQYRQSASNLRVSKLPQTDTLIIPFIEDFSGAMVPIKKISIDTLKAIVDSLGRNKADTEDSIFKVLHVVDSVYLIRHSKMHGLSPSDSSVIYLFNVTFPNSITGNDNTADSLLVSGNKYVRIMDKYSFRLYEDKALTIPTPTPVDIHSTGVFSGNWLRNPTPRYSTYPDTLSFLDNDGGVFINDDMAPNAPSTGVASFDGVNYKGIPYATTPANGYADNLTSLPFYLKSYVQADNVGLSFYWQSKSLGDSPLSKEYLAVEFKDEQNNWNQVLQIFGNPSDPSEAFHSAYVLLDPIYLYDGFQYRIRNYGVLNGRFNVWNIDYIYLGKNISSSTAAISDISFSSINKNILTNYTSIPYEHFKNLSNVSGQIKTPSPFIINYSLPALEIRTITFKMSTSDNKLDTITSVENPTTITSPGVYPYTFPTSVDPVKMNAPYILRQNYYFSNIDTANAPLNIPIDMSFNNYRRNETIFYDYYAYDDGTPEISMKLQQSGGVRLAHKYTILQGDELTHLDIGFLKNNGIDLSNFTVFMTVWKPDPTNKLIEIVPNGQAIAVKYSTDINGFVRYEFTPHITLPAGTYYFGLRQEFNYPLFIGYDRNNNHVDKIFTSIDGNVWSPFSSVATYTGSLMLRPVFSNGEELITSREIPDPTNEQGEQFVLFPNPAAEIITFKGNPDQVIIYDINGRILMQNSIEAENNSISVENLPNGIYVVAVKKNDYTEIKRLIIQK